MKNVLVRTFILGTFIVMPACASLAQDPNPVRPVTFSAEELDNLVAPVALHADALLAQILVASTYPDQVREAAQFVRERGTRGIDDQNWDLSVKSVAHYPPVLNMLATQDDWAIALGQAYAGQPGEVMDAVQRLREMARAQGNLSTTKEQTVTVEKHYITIEPANPEVIYVPTYDPYYVYAYPAFNVGYYNRYFHFGIGFPLGPWLSYDVDWYGRRVYYDGWYGGGWRYYARRHFGVISPVYVHPSYRYVNVGRGVYGRQVNYAYLNKGHRYVWQNSDFSRHDRDWDRNGNRNGYNGDDRRGPNVGSRGGDRVGLDNDDIRGPRTNGPGGDDGRVGDRNGPGNDGSRVGDGGRRGGGANDRGGNGNGGNRIATFDQVRPDKGGNVRSAEPVTKPSGFGRATEGRRESAPTTRPRTEAGSNAPTVFRGRVNPPSFTAPPKSAAGKASSSSNGRTTSSDFRSSGRAPTPEIRGTRPNATVYSRPGTVSGGKASGGFVGQAARPSVRMSPGGQSSSGAVRGASAPGGASVKSSGGSVGRPSSGGSGSVRSSGVRGSRR